MNDNYNVIKISLDYYKKILSNVAPKNYYENEVRKIETAMEWLDNQLDFLDDYRQRSREEN